MSTGATRCAGDVSGTGAVTYGPAMTTSTSAAAGRTVDLADVFARLDRPWQPKVVARLNDYEIKCARLEGARRSPLPGLVTAAGVQGDAELRSGPGSAATARPVLAAGRRQVRGVDPPLDQHRLPAVIDDVHDTTAPPRHRPVRWPVGPLHHHASEAPRAVRQPADPAVPCDNRAAPTGLRTRRHRPRGSWCRPGCRDLAALGQRRSRPSTHPTRQTREHDTVSRTPVRLPGETTRCALPMLSASPRPEQSATLGGTSRLGAADLPALRPGTGA